MSRLVRFVEVILLIMLLVVLTRVDWRLFTSLDNPEAIDRWDNAAEGRIGVDNGIDNQPTAELLALFDDDGGDSAARPGAAPVRETPLQLVLRGILLQRGSENRLALIEGSSKEEKVYRVGDKIEGAEIIRIEPRRVVLGRNGVNESLTLKVNRFERQAPGEAEVSRAVNDGVRKVDRHNITIKRGTLTTQLRDLSGLLGQARTEPYREQGREVGFRVVQVENGSLIQDLGLKQDDILRSVNGIDVRNKVEAVMAYRQLRKEDVFSLDLLRDGKPVTINYSIR